MTKLQLTGSPRRITPETIEQRVVIAPKEESFTTDILPTA